jgi:hypothetical protein
MPTLAAALDFAKYEGKQFRAHQLGALPGSPVTGQLAYLTSDNTLYWWDGTIWQSAKGGSPGGAAGGDLAGTYPNPTVALLAITDAKVAAANKDGLAAVPSLRTLGTGAQQAASGTDARFTDSRAPNGTAGGDLSGTYPNPGIAAGVIINADVNAAAAIARSKLDFGTGLVNSDIAAAAAIAYAKLALTNTLMNADINSAAAIAWSKINSANAIVNADIAPAAAIVYSKLNLVGSILNADIGSAAAIAYSKLALTGAIQNADLFGGIALSKLATDPLARANHTGTQLAATISNFDTQVRTSRLDQMAVPTAAVSFGGQRQTNVADGIAATDGVTKQQLDAVATGLDVKASVRVASTANVTLSAPGANIDGVAMVANDRVLLKNQTAPAENGIWVWNGAAAAMTRATDADVSAEITPGMFTFVEEGTANQDTGWVLTTNAPITLATTGLVFTQFSGAGQYVGGNGLTLTGTTFDVNVDGASIEINADILRVKGGGIVAAMLAAASVNLATTTVTGTLPLGNGGTGQTTAKAARETGLAATGYYSSATHGAGTTITITAATHGLRASRGLQVQVQDEAVAGGTPGSVVLPDIVVAANGDVTVTFGVSVSANTYRVTIIG